MKSITRMMKPVREGSAGKIKIDGAQLIFRNFRGEEKKYNAAGDRNFCVFIDDEAIVQQMIEDGWNIKRLRPRDDQDEARAYLQVKIRYNNIPPEIYMISGDNMTLLNEDTISTLDWAEIENVDLCIRPYTWEVNGKTGIKAYVDSMYVTIVEDDYRKKYANKKISNAQPSTSFADNDDDLPF